MHKEITVESVKQAVKDGAKSVTQIGIAHGYAKPVSGSVTAKIRAAVPEIADILSGKIPVEPVKAVKPVKPVKPVKAIVVKAKKVKVEKTEKTEKVVIHEVGHKTVRAERADAVKRVRPYAGKVYGAVFAEALASGEVEFKPWVEATAAKLGMTYDQVYVAANVMRTRNHRSNGGRSVDVSQNRGFMKLEALVAKASEPAEVPAADHQAVA